MIPHTSWLLDTLPELHRQFGSKGVAMADALHRHFPSAESFDWEATSLTAIAYVDADTRSLTRLWPTEDFTLSIADVASRLTGVADLPVCPPGVIDEDVFEFGNWLIARLPRRFVVDLQRLRATEKEVFKDFL
jgi:hypothetical protein